MRQPVDQQPPNMSKLVLLTLFTVILTEFLAIGCLITNCPRGGKRASKMHTSDASPIKQCISCGPGQSGQCFGPNICCGPFGCLIGTSDSIKCLREGLFHEREPCIAGSAPCRKNTGRCAFDGVCCGQDSCFVDKSCGSDEKIRFFNENSLDLYNLINYPMEITDK